MAQNLDSLWTSFEHKRWLAFVAPLLLRPKQLQCIEELKNCSKNEITAESTGF